MSRSKKKPEVIAIDPGTKEMARHFSVVPKMIDNNTRAMRVLDSTETDKLLLNDLITPAQHSTLNAFAHKMRSYGMLTLKSPDLEPSIASDPSIVADRKAQSLIGAVKLFRDLDHAIGRHRRMKLVSLALEDRPWGKLKHQIEDLHYAIKALDELLTRR